MRADAEELVAFVDEGGEALTLAPARTEPEPDRSGEWISSSHTISLEGAR